MYLDNDIYPSGSQYPDPDPTSGPSSVSAFNWMGGYQPVQEGNFPTSHGPIVHEGFVPDTSEENGFYATAFDPQLNTFTDLAYGPVDDSEENPHYLLSESEEGDDSNMSLDEDAEEPDVDAENPLGVYAGTRSRQSGGVRRIWSDPEDSGRGRGGGRGRNRGRGSARGSARERGRGRGRGSGRGRGGKGVKRGPRPALDPSREFVELQKEAISIFIDGRDHDKALEIIQRAIAINPEMYTAHSLLSNIYFEKGDDEKAVAALFSGAHAAPRDPSVWQNVAEACLHCRTSDRTTALQQAAYCFSRLVDIDPLDQDSRLRRAAINRELGNYTKALNELQKMLVQMPHNSRILRQIAEVYIDIHQIEKAKQLYEESIALHKSAGFTGDSAFSWSDINVYVELFSYAEEYDKGIATLKSLSRWIVGREEEVFWDDITDDDREWDADDDPRRVEVAKYVPRKYPLDAYGVGLPLELRVKLGVYRLNQHAGHRSEAFGHFEWLEPEHLEPEHCEPRAKIFDYADLFQEAATALREAKEYEEALRYYEPLRHTNAYSDVDFWLAIAACHYVCGNQNQALQCYEAAKAADDTCADARTQLAKIYKDMGDRENALKNAHEALKIGRKAIARPARRRYERREAREAREAAERALKEAHKLPLSGSEPAKSGLPAPNFDGIRSLSRLNRSSKAPPHSKRAVKDSQADKRKLSQRMNIEDADLRRTNNIQHLYSTLLSNTASMREGDLVARNIWLDCSGELIADFRSQRVFYPYERHITFRGYDRESRALAFQKKWRKESSTALDRDCSESTMPENEADTPIPSMESSIPTEYRGISFDDWLDVFLEHALILAKTSDGSTTKCYTIVNAALDCTIWYHQPESMLQIYVCWFTCALALNDANTLFNVVARWFMRQYQFCTDTYRLFSALNLFYTYPPVPGGKDTQLQLAHFRLGPSQKFMFRQVKAVDALLPPDYNTDGEDGPVPEFMREEARAIGAEVEKDNREGNGTSSNPETPGIGGGGKFVKPQEMDVVLLTLYAHILYAGGSYPNALHYFYRAYALDPKNPMVLLSMALSYTHQMFKRQNENRHMYVMQGLAFFQEYADCRMERGRVGGPLLEQQARMEVEFNRARIWQMLGLSNLAVRGYANVLEERSAAVGIAAAGKWENPVQPDDGATEQDQDGSVEEYSREAAYALQTIYALSGDAETAREITEKWLVLD